MFDGVMQNIRRSIVSVPPREWDNDGEEAEAVRAAVAVILAPSEHGLSLLFIRRSVRANDPWSGHMAFPGGRLEETDETLWETAERETFEEVGLRLDGSCCRLGGLSEVVSPIKVFQNRTRRVVVTPYIYFVERRPPLHPNEEVAATHWFSIADLQAPENRQGMPYTYNNTLFLGQGVQGAPQPRKLWMPVIALEGQEIWGMTLRMLDELLWRISGAAIR